MQASPLSSGRTAERGTARTGRPEFLAPCRAGRTQQTCVARRVGQACLCTARMLVLGLALWPVSVLAEEPLRIDINAGTSITDSSVVTLNGQSVGTAAALNAPTQSLVVQSTSSTPVMAVKGLVDMVVHDFTALTNAPHAGTTLTIEGNATNITNVTVVGDGNGQSLIRHQLLDTTSVQDIEKVIVNN